MKIITLNDLFAPSPTENTNLLSRAIRRTGIFVAIVIALGCGSAVNAQDEQNIQFTQGKVGSGLEFSLAVPIKSYPGRGGTGINVSLNYSSKVWRAAHLATVVRDSYGYYATIAEVFYSEWSTAGWNSSLELPKIEWPKWEDRYWSYGSAMSPKYSASATAYRVARVFIHMPDGSTHELRQSDTPSATSGIVTTGEFYAVDGSRMRYTSTGPYTGTLYLQDGTRYVLGGSSYDSYLIDRFGNYITYDHTDGKWNDALGREIGSPLPSNPTDGQEVEYSVPGLGGNLTYTFHWENLGDALTPDESSGTPDLKPIAEMYLPTPSATPTNFDQSNYPLWQQTSIPLDYALFQDYSNTSDPEAVPPLIVGRGQAHNAVFDPVVLRRIDLPNGTYYEFSYNIYGEIDRVKYPTGAVENCAYEMMPGDGTMTGPYDQANRGTVERTYSANGTGSDDVTWEYASQEYSYQTKVTATAPDGTRSETIRKKITPPTLGTHGAKYWGFDFSDPLSGMETEVLTYASTANGGGLLSRKLIEYERTANFVLENANNIDIYAFRNARPVRETQIIFNGTGNALAKSTTFAYDTTYEMTTGVDQTEVVEYGFVSLSHSDASTSVIGSISTGTALRKVHTTYLTSSDYRGLNILGLPTVVSVRDASDDEVARAETSYDLLSQLTYGGTITFWTDPGSGVKRGLATNVKKYTNLSSSQYIESSVQYDQFGNARKSWDGNSNLSEVAYSSTHAYAYPTTTTSQVPVRSSTDSTGLHGSGDSLLSTITYDAMTGSVLTKIDPNGHVSTLTYADDMDRPSSVDSPDGGRVEFVYGDTPGSLFITRRTKLDASNWQETTKYFDGLARPVKVKQNDAVGVTFVETEYDNMGRAWRTSNPYRSGDTIIWTTSAFDDLGRVTQVETPDGSAVTTEFGMLTSGGLLGATTLVTDQASKKRKSVTDGLGNLARVIEDPTNLAYETNYSYDLLGNLLTVTQVAGAVTQTRTFDYDDASRLTSASNPESGTISYEYDPNGNLTGKTDARTIETNYFYDGLNRVIKRTYTAPSPLPDNYSATSDVKYYYDGKGLSSVPDHSLGKLTKVANDESETLYTEFDVAGRILKSEQITDGLDVCANGGSACVMTYQYNRAGALTQETYPSGRQVNHNYGTDGKLAAVSSRVAKNRPFKAYAQAFSYNAAGGVTGMQLGNMRWESTTFNTRLQLTQIALGTTPGATDMLDLDYTYETSGASYHDNNGNVLTQTITVDDVGANPGFVATQTYTYDELNRLKSATENSAQNGGSSTQSWKQTYLFDRFGNRRFDTASGASTTIPGGCSTAVCNPTVDLSNNRFAAGQGYEYDAAGGVTQDAEGKKFVYGGESKQTSFGTGGEDDNVGNYIYDGDGQRVKAIVGADVTIFVYNAFGQTIAEYSPAGLSGSSLIYLTTDNLGTPRITTDASGAIIARHDYMPFGEEIGSIGHRGYVYSYGEDGVRRGFTSQERDDESGLDYFGARYYYESLGRFTTSDPALTSANVGSPQSWNRYAYAFNNPLMYCDPTGAWNWSAEYGGDDDDKVLKQNAGKDKAAKAKADEIIKKRQLFRNAISDARLAALKSDDPGMVNGALDAYGKETDKNGVTVTFGTLGGGIAAEAKSDKGGLRFDNGIVTALVLVTISSSVTNPNELAQAVGHEGIHVRDRQGFASFLNSLPKDPNTGWLSAENETYAYQEVYNQNGVRTEYAAYLVSGLIAQGLDKMGNNFPNSSIGGHLVWDRNWKAAEVPTLRSNGAIKILNSPRYKDKLFVRQFPGP